MCWNLDLPNIVGFRQHSTLDPNYDTSLVSVSLF